MFEGNPGVLALRRHTSTLLKEQVLEDSGQSVIGALKMLSLNLSRGDVSCV